MNRVLYRSDERHGEIVTLHGERAAHVRNILGLDRGASLRVGELNGCPGEGRVRVCEDDLLEFEVLRESEPLPPSPLKIVLALPRPKACGRILESLTELGVKHVVLLHANKVEKSYWDAHQLRLSEIEKHLLMGLQQAGDTVLPKVTLAPRFRPFVEDELESWAAGCAARWVLHPSSSGALDILPSELNEPSVVAIGPEGGWVDFEVELLVRFGFRVASLGQRVLSSETVVSAVAARALGRKV